MHKDVLPLQVQKILQPLQLDLDQSLLDLEKGKLCVIEDVVNLENDS